MVKGHPDFTRPIDFEVQSVGVKTEAEWQAYQGAQRIFRGDSYQLAQDETDTPISYTVPTGKVLYVFFVSYSSEKALAARILRDGLWETSLADVWILIAQTTAYTATVVKSLNSPLKVTEGQTISIRVRNVGAGSGDFGCCLHGYEVTA